MSIGGLQFIDSFQHLPCSLDTLAQNLLRDCFKESLAAADYPSVTSDLFVFCQEELPWIEFVRKYISMRDAREKFSSLSEEFPEDEKFCLLLKKGVFPYSWFDDPEKLTEPSLPSIDDFTDVLTQSHCGVQNYQYAKKVWDVFHCFLPSIYGVVSKNGCAFVSRCYEELSESFHG